MKTGAQFWTTAIVMVGILAVVTGVEAARRQDSAEKDRMAIERLHQLDVETTLTDKADELARLWDTDAVRIQPDGPAEVGKAVIYADDKRWEASKGSEKTLCYRTEMQDLRIAGDWAFEWGYFSYKNSSDGKVETGRGKVLRVLHRQMDGSWKFARVMGFPEKLASAAPMSHPCE